MRKFLRHYAHLSPLFRPLEQTPISRYHGQSNLKMPKTAITDTLPLPNHPSSSTTIPQLGFGTYLSHPDQALASCLSALKSGYRHIDTAQYYANEEEVGQAVKKSGLARNSVYLTTKILAPEDSVHENYENCVESVRKLDGKDGYVDLFLIHSPSPGKSKELWMALERLYAEGKARSIGVSNFVMAIP